MQACFYLPFPYSPRKTADFLCSQWSWQCLLSRASAIGLPFRGQCQGQSRLHHLCLPSRSLGTQVKVKNSLTGPVEEDTGPAERKLENHKQKEYGPTNVKFTVTMHRDHEGVLQPFTLAASFCWSSGSATGQCPGSQPHTEQLIRQLCILNDHVSGCSVYHKLRGHEPSNSILWSKNVLNSSGSTS